MGVYRAGELTRFERRGLEGRYVPHVERVAIILYGRSLAFGRDHENEGFSAGFRAV